MTASTVFVARYDLSEGHKQVLLFEKGDRFIHIPNSYSNPNWALCVDMKGEIGFVPYTYVNIQEVSNEEFIWLIDGILEKLHGDSPSSVSKRTRDVIKYLTYKRTELLAGSKGKENRNNIIGNKEVYDNSSYPNQDAKESKSSLSCSPASNMFTSTEDTDNPSIKKDECNSLKENSAIRQVLESATQTDSFSEIKVPTWLVPSLIESVRHKTQLSHDNSIIAVQVILDSFMHALPQLNCVWSEMKKNLTISETIEDDLSNVVYSEDKRKLLDIFKQLWYCKNDEQQRSWPVHEDEDHISSLLVDLNNILLDANPRISREVVQCDDYEMVNLLATYYQMEPRKALRVKMLHVFLTLCELDITVVTHLLNSVLPAELARDIQDNFEEEEKVNYSSYLLTVIFSTGEQPPNGTYEELVKDGEEDIGQNLLRIILAFNLHFQDYQDNLVLQTLKERDYAQALTERLVFLLNREEDPTKILDHDLSTPNSVLKFMVDLFSFHELIELFYLNDIKVLLDIVVRQLSDLLPGEKKRLDYLRLVQNLLRNSNYAEHMHQINGLRKCFQFVLAQEVPEADEAAIILDILNEFPSWFQEK